MIGIVACSKSKLDRAAPSVDLYTSQLFKLSIRYARDHCDHVYVASALHGLVELDAVLEPYDRTLASMRRRTRNHWGTRITRQVLARHPDDPHVLVLAGETYVEPIRLQLDPRYVLIDALKGMQIGERLAFLAAQVSRRAA